jgi:hypothetical protein
LENGKEKYGKYIIREPIEKERVFTVETSMGSLLQDAG